MAFGMSGRSTTFAFVAEDKFSKTADHVSRKAGKMGGGMKKAKACSWPRRGCRRRRGGCAGRRCGLKAVKVAEEQSTASARLAKVLDSMGYAKNAKAADKYADSLEQVVAVDSAEIKAGQAKLATFADIAKSQKLMQRSTLLTADMAAAGFGSISSNAVGLGKALQDPVKGMTLLSKQGSLTKAEQEEDRRRVQEDGRQGARPRSPSSRRWRSRSAGSVRPPLIQLGEDVPGLR